MKRYLLGSILLFLTSTSLASILIAQEGNIYRTGLQMSGFQVVETEPSLKDVLFLKLNMESNRYVISSKELFPLSSFSWKKKSAAPKIPKLEGCGQHPMSWLKASKIIATIKKSKDILIQAPSKTNVLEKYPTELPATLAKILTKRHSRQPDYTSEEMSKVLNNSVTFQQGNKTIVYALFDDDLNQAVMILETSASSPWELRHWITITDDCP